MEVQLFSVEHAPTSLPIWQTILDDLGRPPAARVAKVLGISVRSVYRYNAAGSAPRVVCLSLFWLTRWGLSWANTNAINDALLAVQLAKAVTRERDDLQLQIRRLEAIGSFGAANDPLLRGPHER